MFVQQVAVAVIAKRFCSNGKGREEKGREASGFKWKGKREMRRREKDGKRKRPREVRPQRHNTTRALAGTGAAFLSCGYSNAAWEGGFTWSSTVIVPSASPAVPGHTPFPCPFRGAPPSTPDCTLLSVHAMCVRACECVREMRGRERRKMSMRGRTRGRCNRSTIYAIARAFMRACVQLKGGRVCVCERERGEWDGKILNNSRKG